MHRRDAEAQRKNKSKSKPESAEGAESAEECADAARRKGTLPGKRRGSRRFWMDGPKKYRCEGHDTFLNIVESMAIAGATEGSPWGT